MAAAHSSKMVALKKSPTGIGGFDEITLGGLPQGRPSLICGSAGCGKTLFALEFLVRGATQFNEPGVFVAFEETPEELARNVASLGFDLNDLIKKKKLFIDYVQLNRNEIQETGEYDLEGLFIRLNYAIDSIGARRLALDTIETLFAGLPNEAILRSELVRLFRWTKTKGVTSITTAERGEGTLTRHGLEEYVADCVVLLDHRLTDQISTRRLRIVKYRGSFHGTNEYPFLIGKRGISVLPVTSLGLTHKASNEWVSTGIPRLDSMLGGKGVYRGTSVLVSGTAGTGKTTLASKFVEETCRRGQRALYIAFEESPSQIARNMRSVGIKIEPYIKNGLLHIHATRPTYSGLEMHLVGVHDLINEFKPSVIVFDPITNLTAVGTLLEVRSMLTRMIDFLKLKNITGMFLSLTSGGNDQDQSEVGVSSLMDTWLLVRNLESGGERNRALYILKSRGMAHSNQVREFRISNKGIDLVDVYVGSGDVLVGSARLAQQSREKAEERTRQRQLERRRQELARKRATIESQIAALRAELESEHEELNDTEAQETSRKASLNLEQQKMAKLRKAD